MANLLAVSIALVMMLQGGLFGQSPQNPQSARREQIYAQLIGSWTGQLEYRDFQTDQRVFLPTWLEVKAAGDGQSLSFRLCL